MEQDIGANVRNRVAKAQKNRSTQSGTVCKEGVPSGLFLEVGGSGAVEVEGSVRMLLKVGGGDVDGDGAFDGFLYDGSFLVAPGHEGYLAGSHDGGDAHGDGGCRDIFLASEGGCGVRDGEVVEMHLAGDGGIVGAGFVEADVAGASDAENLKVDAAAVLDFLFVGGAVGRDVGIGQHAGGQVDVFRLDIDVVEEVLVHEVPVGFLVFVGKTTVFVEVEGDDVGEGEAFFLVQADQLGVEGEGVAPVARPRTTCLFSAERERINAATSAARIWPRPGVYRKHSLS